MKRGVRVKKTKKKSFDLIIKMKVYDVNHHRAKKKEEDEAVTNISVL